MAPWVMCYESFVFGGLGQRRDDCNGGGSVMGQPTLLSGSARVRVYDTLVFLKGLLCMFIDIIVYCIVFH